MFKYISSLFILMVSIALGDSGYYIENYRIGIDIDEKNIYSIEEKIDTQFISPRRGIIRTLPLEYDDRKIKISDIKVDAPFVVKNEGDYLTIRIGNPNQYIRGRKTYILDYRYHLGWDGIKDYDEVYFNLVGSYWDTSIKQVEFSITLPKNFDAKKLNFTLGERGSRERSGVIWSVKGNTITGHTTRPLAPYESLTVALPLPEGYFDTGGIEVQYRIANGIIYFLIIFLPLLALYIWYRFGRDENPVETVEFYPPDDMNPMEVGYFIDGYLDNKDITSLIFYWADKGYLKIQEEVKKGIFKKSRYTLTKLKDMAKIKDDEYEKYLFDSLFSYAEDGKNLEMEDLRNNYYENIERGKEIFLIDMTYQKRFLYSSKSESLAQGVRLSIFLIIGAIVAKIYFLGFFGSYILIPFGILAIFFILLISRYIKQRTNYYNSVLGRLRGFKRFLMTAEKSKLEMLLEENPSYFYDILPYAIVLGVTEKWADKFKDLVTVPPRWYSTNAGDAFMLGAFMGSFNRSVDNFSSSMSSAPTNTSRGDSSFSGGSSGGGAGGGGGSSW